METVRLKNWFICSQARADTPFPKRDPSLDGVILVLWRAEKVNMIRHYQIETDQPRVSLPPGLDECTMCFRIREL